MSEHAAVTVKPADDPAFQLPSRLSGLAIPLCVGGLAALIIGFCVGTFSVDARFGYSAYLTAFTYCLTISLGALFFVLIQHLCRAGWSVVVRRVAELMMVLLVPLAILFIPILVSTYTGSLYAWSIEGYAEAHHLPEEIWEQKTRWLNAPWFTFRSALYLVIWCGLAVWYFRKSRLQDETGEVTLTEKMQARSGPAVILFSVCTTFAAFDWLMSLAPMWFSTMFGVYIFTGSVLTAHCAIAVMSYMLQKTGAMRDEVTVEHYHDLGKLIFGFVVFWGYIAFSQYMLIWYGNIPEETHWFFVRSVGPWSFLSLVLVTLHWIVPFAGTMSRHVRRRPSLMFGWGLYIMVLHYVDVYWIVMPEVEQGVGGVLGAIACLLCLLGMAGLLFGLMLKVADQTRVVPVRDPRLRESLAFENV